MGQADVTLFVTPVEFGRVERRDSGELAYFASRVTLNPMPSRPESGHAARAPASEPPPRQSWRGAFGPKWIAALVAPLIVAFVVARANNVFASPDQTPSTPPSHGIQEQPSGPPLRAVLTPVDPGDFQVATRDDTGLPSESTGWSELIAQGGVDVETGSFAVTLTNRSNVPLTVDDIHVEILNERPAPRGSLAFVYTQATGAKGQFAVEIEDTTPGTKSRLHRVTESPDQPFFATHVIDLRPGEIYKATVAVRLTLVTRTVTGYGFVIAGSTPTRDFQIRRGGGRISGLFGSPSDEAYGHYYVRDYLEYANRSGLCNEIKVRRWYALPPGGMLTNCPPLPGAHYG